jgi:hypothetical protein
VPKMFALTRRLVPTPKEKEQSNRKRLFSCES